MISKRMVQCFLGATPYIQGVKLSLPEFWGYGLKGFFGWSRSQIRRPHSTNQKFVQGECPHSSP